MRRIVSTDGITLCRPRLDVHIDLAIALNATADPFVAKGSSPLALSIGVAGERESSTGCCMSTRHEPLPTDGCRSTGT